MDLSLNLIDGIALPANHRKLDGTTFERILDRVFRGLLILAHLLTCFKHSRSDDTQTLEGDIYPRIVESWSNIASWLIMLAEYASQYSRTDDILGLCSDVLQGIAHEADHNPQKLELLSARITGVAICALLSQSPDVGGPVECAIVETFSSFVSTIEGRQNFILTLKSFSKTRRYYVIASLIECSVQLAAIPTNRGVSRVTIVQHLDRLTKAVVFLLEADDDLLPPLAKLTFIERCAASYTSIAEEASRDASIRDAELWNLLST